MDEIIKRVSARLSITNPEDRKRIEAIGYALSLPMRVDIFTLILNRSISVSGIAEALSLPLSSVSRHVEILREAGLITIDYRPGPKGHSKYCAQALVDLTLDLNADSGQNEAEREVVLEMPIGLFSHCHILPGCGMLSEQGSIGELNDPRVFFTPERAKAECLWFQSGSISYNFPTNLLSQHPFSEISFSFEICSEAPYYNNDWPSDITLSINQQEIVTFTSQGDFGGRRGKYTPAFWPITSTQFGLLRTLTVAANGAYLDNKPVNDAVTFDSLRLLDGNAICFTIAIKEDARHRGGINLFGKHFGDYPQHILMRLR